ncbi:Polyketide cyclase / dehydrase and lipid transport [Acinetobacter marinus]|uniref:Polyketide cyclase / dehydrase and lipid transport n=1 Tax=Acinetobacter marinus TaxID=281375 RepID=A0A1G6HGL9_9GAMM|nr:SRPBCC family protein [Acinetobacter marinus]SDB93075.1 Polyketide cyclase / dehydrase and lipid transport [Acinetobacter marinus]
MHNHTTTACISFVLTGLLIGMPNSSFAKLVTWQDPTPSALAPFNHSAKQVAELANDDILLYSHVPKAIQYSDLSGTRSYKNAQYSSAALVLNATPEQVYNTLKNYAGYAGLFPTLKKAEVLETNTSDTSAQEQISQVKYQVSIPTPIKVLNFDEDITLQHHLTKNSMSSLVIDSPFPHGMGKFEWFALGKNKTLITLTHWNDLNVSKGFLISTLLKAMPEIKTGIPYSANTFALEALNEKFNGKAKAVKLGAGKVPEKLTTLAEYQHLIQLSKKSKQPITFVHRSTAVPYKHGDENLRFSTSYQYFSAKSDQSKQLLSPNIFKTLFSNQVKSVKLIQNQDQLKSQDAIYDIRVGLGVINIPFSARIRFVDLAKNSSENSLANSPENSLENHVDMYAVGGDVKLMKSRMSVKDFGSGSVWKVIAAGKIHKDAPFLLRAMRSLPYHDVLPSASMASVVSAKADAKLGL